MNTRRLVVTGVSLLAIGVGASGCHDSASTTPAPSGGDELSSIQTTLNAIDSEVAGDESQ
ncbi:hypothetical protein HFP15_14375 [Amycolatopsis sp. K13G38]|uniref:Uncharacterized protein n=1 Tax=Amycolatopsis acididurans TaxID=2724524 RepID=A0ABX1J6U9_9PSEU|nr:hypothetical protein [Amycolatopsis acididurans]NKQ54070.1 hypothetical protein [Amycolatopsis acididurans]